MSYSTSNKSQSIHPHSVAANDEVAERSVNHDTQSTDACQPIDLRLKSQLSFWLEWQSRMINGVIHSALFVSNDTDSGWNSADYWPATADSEDVSTQLSEYSREAISRAGPIVRPNQSLGGSLVDILVQPFNLSLAPGGAVCFVLSPRSDSQRESVSQLVQWCVLWLENLLETEEPVTDDTRDAVLEAVALVSAAAPLAVTANQFCEFIAGYYDCSVVAVGQPSRVSTHIVAVSNQLAFDRRTTRINELAFAMDECLDHGARVVLPMQKKSDHSVVQAHAQLQNQIGDRGVCSLPLNVDGTTSAVLTLVKKGSARFTRGELVQLERIGQATAPILKLQEMAGQSAWRRSRATVEVYGRKIFGRGNLKLKLFTAASLVLPVLLLVIPADYRISAAVTLEGTRRQAVVAPESGYIKQVLARAGDSVASEQVLVELDRSELEIQRNNWQSELEKLEKEYQLAWANRDKADVSIVAAQLAQSRARLALVENSISQTTIVAPFAGILSSGDLDELAGAPVERGQPLFELVPIDGHKAVLHIDEYDVGKLQEGQQGRLRLTGLPSEVIEFRLNNVFPVAIAQQGKNTFRVEAILHSTPENLRPGMTGVAKVTVGRGSLLGAWTRSLRERLKMRLWFFGF